MSMLSRFRLSVAKAIAPRPVNDWANTGRWTAVHDRYPGAWQQNADLPADTVEKFSAVYACIDLISSDIAKLRPRLVEWKNGVWVEDVLARRPVLQKPNRYQTRIQFFREWLNSKLYAGNTYILLERDERNAIVAMYVLNPKMVEPMVTQDGGVYYKLHRNWLAGLDQDEAVYVPASEIIHDRGLPMYHPLLGVSPVHACAVSASLGAQITSSGSKFFGKAARPSGILTAPGKISDETAVRLKSTWETQFSGNNAGSIAVLGDNLKYEPMTMTASDAQQLEQLSWSIVDVARCFHVPAHKIGAGPSPTFNNISALNQSYYAETLQIHIEEIEALMDQAFGFGPTYGFEFDLEGLLRMDPLGRADANQKGLGAGYLSPNEARAREGLPPVEGGEEPVLQQQNWPLSSLAGRPPPDAKPEPTVPPEPSPEEEDQAAQDAAEKLLRRFKRKAAAAEYRT